MLAALVLVTMRWSRDKAASFIGCAVTLAHVCSWCPEGLEPSFLMGIGLVPTRACVVKGLHGFLWVALRWLARDLRPASKAPLLRSCDGEQLV